MKKPSLLRALRAAREPKITQSQLGRLAGLPLFRIWQIENGEGASASKAEREAIATALGVKISDIFWPEWEQANAS